MNALCETCSADQIVLLINVKQKVKKVPRSLVCKRGT
jgi:hypothetical protein